MHPWLWLMVAALNGFAAVQAQTPSEPVRDETGGDVIGAFEVLTARVADAVDRYNAGDKAVDLTLMDVALLNLEAAVRTRTRNQVDRNTTRTLTLAAKDRALFGQTPVLPAEDKRGGRWTFKPVRFDAVPGSLFTFAVTFQADVTLRLRAVRLIFRDGSERLDDRWSALDGGNGQEFPKDEPIPWIPVFGPDQPRTAKALAAVEIIGSAQDGNQTARLRFQLEIPDPAADPGGETLALIGRIKRNWDGQTASANRLNQCLLDCRDLAAALNVPFCFDTPAVD